MFVSSCEAGDACCSLGFVRAPSSIEIFRTSGTGSSRRIRSCATVLLAEPILSLDIEDFRSVDSDQACVCLVVTTHSVGYIIVDCCEATPSSSNFVFHRMSISQNVPSIRLLPTQSDGSSRVLIVNGEDKHSMCRFHISEPLVISEDPQESASTTASPGVNTKCRTIKIEKELNLVSTIGTLSKLLTPSTLSSQSALTHDRHRPFAKHTTIILVNNSSSVQEFLLHKIGTSLFNFLSPFHIPFLIPYLIPYF